MIVLGWRTGSERVYSRRTSISEVRLTGRAPALRGASRAIGRRKPTSMSSWRSWRARWMPH